MCCWRILHFKNQHTSSSDILNRRKQYITVDEIAMCEGKSSHATPTCIWSRQCISTKWLLHYGSQKTSAKNYLLLTSYSPFVCIWHYPSPVPFVNICGSVDLLKPRLGYHHGPNVLLGGVLRYCRVALVGFNAVPAAIWLKLVFKTYAVVKYLWTPPSLFLMDYHREHKQFGEIKDHKNIWKQ